MCCAGLYYPPEEGSRSSFLAYIDSLPATPLPEAFGLHANADIAKVGRDMEVHGCVLTHCQRG